MTFEARFAIGVPPLKPGPAQLRLKRGSNVKTCFALSLSATHAFPCLALKHRDIFVDHFRLAMATEHNLPAVLRHLFDNPLYCLKHLSIIVD